MTRFGNVVVACGLIVLTLPLMVLVALAIRVESPGPALERHERFARGARRYTLLTFRTTVDQETDTLPIWGRKPTRVEAFLRYTRIDGLPKLLNVLRGDLSFSEMDD